MNQNHSTITTKAPQGTLSQRAAALCVSLLLLMFASPIFAHGGFDHVTGTISKADTNMIMVTTAKGEVGLIVRAKYKQREPIGT